MQNCLLLPTSTKLVPSTTIDMPETMNLNRLGDYFSSEDIEWKPIATSKRTGKGLAAAYVTNRAIMDRLDEVCGPENWKNTFKTGPDGGVICGLSIRVPREEGFEWITKWDGAENTSIEPVKGGLSSSMRRAAVQWGIGRYLYRMPSQWIPVDERGRFKKTPRIPSEFLPGREDHSRSARQPDRAQARAHSDPEAYLRLSEGPAS